MSFTGPHLATPIDSHAIAICHTSAFSSAGPRTVYNLIFSKCNQEAMVDLEAKMIEKNFKLGLRSKIVVMRDEGTGEIISYAQWILPVSEEIEKEEGQKEMIEQEKGQKKQLDFPDGTNMGLFKKVFIDRRASDGENLSDLPVSAEQCWNLSRIGTKPEYQGKGAARALLKWGTDQADQEGKYCDLSTDPEQAAFRAYERAGFAVVGNYSNMDLKPFGYDGVLKYARMLRKPQGEV